MIIYECVSLRVDVLFVGFVNMPDTSTCTSMYIYSNHTQHLPGAN